MVVAVLGAIAGLNLGMVASHVQASYDPGRGDCGQRGYSWEFCGYHQPSQPTLTPVSEYSCHWWSDGFSHCGPGGYAYNQQPTISQTAFFRDNCFWSFPVQCSQVSDGLNLHLRTL